MEKVKKKTGRPKKTIEKNEAPATPEVEQPITIKSPVETAQKPATKAQSKAISRPTFDKNADIWVVSQCPGELHFVSKRTGSEVIWSEVGSGQWLTYEDLLEIANSQKKFFIRNWIIVPDDVLVSLRMDKYYVGSLSLDEYETVFDISIEEMFAKLKNLPEGQKKTLAYKAAMLNSDGKIDSKARIAAIEEALDIELTY